MIRNLILLGLSFLFVGCNTVVDEERLIDELAEFRLISKDKISVTSKRNYDIAFVKKEHISYSHPENYMVGKPNKLNNDYEFVVYLTGISPLKEFSYVEKVLNIYDSDSTQVRFLTKEEKKLKACIYRRIKDDDGYMIWKWVSSPYGKTAFETEKYLNRQLFN